MPRKIGSKGGIRPSTLKKMSSGQLKKAGYVRIPGFTRKDGTKVKSHIRMLKPATGGKEVTKQLAELAIDFTPIVGDIKAGAEALKSFSDKDYLAGAVLTVGAVIGLVPLLGDAAKIPIKAFAKTLKASTKAVKAATKAPPSTARVAVDLVSKKTLKFSDEGGDILKQAKAQRLVKAQVQAEKRLAKSKLLQANIKKEFIRGRSCKSF